MTEPRRPSLGRGPRSPRSNAQGDEPNPYKDSGDAPAAVVIAPKATSAKASATKAGTKKASATKAASAKTSTAKVRVTKAGATKASATKAVATKTAAAKTATARTATPKKGVAVVDAVPDAKARGRARNAADEGAPNDAPRATAPSVVTVSAPLVSSPAPRIESAPPAPPRDAGSDRSGPSSERHADRPNGDRSNADRSNADRSNADRNNADRNNADRTTLIETPSIEMAPTGTAATEMLPIGVRIAKDVVAGFSADADAVATSSVRARPTEPKHQRRTTRHAMSVHHGRSGTIARRAMIGMSADRALSRRSIAIRIATTIGTNVLKCRDRTSSLPRPRSQVGTIQRAETAASFAGRLRAICRSRAIPSFPAGWRGSSSCVVRI